MGSEPFDDARTFDSSRLRALHDTALLDTGAEEAFDRLTRLASRLLRAPIAALSLVDNHRQFFKSAVGLPEPWATLRETPLSHSFCRHVVDTEDTLRVDDSRTHPLVSDNPAIDALGVAAYLGVPLRTGDGHVLGALCVIDVALHRWSDEDAKTLQDVASSIVTEMDLRARNRALEFERSTLRAVLDAMSDVVNVIDCAGNIVLRNAAGEGALGLTSAETSQKDVTSYGVFMADGVTPCAADEMPSVRAVREGRANTSELFVRAPAFPEGRWESVNASPIRGSDNTLLGAVAVARDVTEQRAIRAEIEASERQYRLLADNTNDLIRVHDLDGRHVYITPSCSRLLGYTVSEMMNLTREELLHEDDREGILTRMRVVIDSGVTGGPFVHRFRTKNGEYRWFETILSPVIVDAQVAQIHSASRDVTDRIRAEDALRDSEARFRSLSDATFEGIGMLADGVLFDANLALAGMFGYERHELIGMTSENLVTREDAGTVTEHQRAHDRDIYECTAVRKDGTKFPVEVRGRAVQWCDKLVRVAAVRDLTDRKRTEKSLAQQVALVRLLEAAAVTANEASSVEQALHACLAIVGAHMGWLAGNAYVRRDASCAAFDLCHVWYADGAELERGLFSPVNGQKRALVADAWFGPTRGSKNAPVVVRAAASPIIEDARSGDLLGLAFPILLDDEVVATLEFFSTHTEEPDRAALAAMVSVGTQLARVFERDRAKRELERSAAEVRSLSLRDELTGLYNRRGFLELTQQAVRIAARANRGALLFFCDLNEMKAINDQYGHDEGDEALRATTSLLQLTFRDADIIARLGGDEFVVFVPDVVPECAGALRDRLEANVRDYNATVGGTRPWRVSLSIGFAIYDPREPRTVETLIAEADARMYDAKKLRRRMGSSTAPSALHAPSQGTSRQP